MNDAATTTPKFSSQQAMMVVAGRGARASPAASHTTTQRRTWVVLACDMTKYTSDAGSPAVENTPTAGAVPIHHTMAIVVVTTERWAMKVTKITPRTRATSEATATWRALLTQARA